VRDDCALKGAHGVRFTGDPSGYTPTTARVFTPVPSTAAKIQPSCATL
jgi:hypothetical protein